MKKARFLPAVRSEFLAEVRYYNEARSDLGAQFAAAVEAAVIRALKFPLSGSRSPADMYRISLRDFPFSIFYRPDGESIIVFAVAHNSRKPGYWKERKS
jgi:plasmid stabilization system protein ParE